MYQEIDQFGLWIKASCVEKLVLTKRVNFQCYLPRGARQGGSAPWTLGSKPRWLVNCTLALKGKFQSWESKPLHGLKTGATIDCYG